MRTRARRTRARAHTALPAHRPPARRPRRATDRAPRARSPDRRRARAETNRCSELTSKRLGYDVSCAHLIERDRDRGRISATAERSDGGGLAFGGGAARKRSAPVEIAVHM